jgi:hypothetical protein
MTLHLTGPALRFLEASRSLQPARQVNAIVRRPEAEVSVSFDVFVQDLPPGARTVADIPDNFAPRPIGRRTDIVAGILRAAPAADFTEPTWGHIAGPGYSIELNIGPEEVLESFAFHVRGGQEALFIVADILRELGLRALAPGTASGFFEHSELGPAYAQWQAYRQQVVGGSPQAVRGKGTS